MQGPPEVLECLRPLGMGATGLPSKTPRHNAPATEALQVSCIEVSRLAPLLAFIYPLGLPPPLWASLTCYMRVVPDQPYTV